MRKVSDIPLKTDPGEKSSCPFVAFQQEGGAKSWVGRGVGKKYIAAWQHLTIQENLQDPRADLFPESLQATMR